MYKGENGERMERLERSNISVVITLRGLQRSVDALATKEGVSTVEHDVCSMQYAVYRKPYAL